MRWRRRHVAPGHGQGIRARPTAHATHLNGHAETSRSDALNIQSFWACGPPRTARVHRPRECTIRVVHASSLKRTNRFCGNPLWVRGL
eukprot:2670778-Prymnesium_polylepis.1